MAVNDSCDRRKRDPPLDLQLKFAIIIESVSWVTEDSLVGSRKDHGDKGYHERKSHSGATTQRHRSAMTSSVGFALVSSTNKPQPQVREQRDKSGQIQGHSQQCNRINMQYRLRWGSHPRACFVRAVTTFLCYACDRDWKLEK